MPGFFNTAEAVAWDLASRNGYTNGFDGVVVTPAAVAGEPHQLRVTIRDEVESFFMKVFGFDTVTIKRESVAEYVLPLPLGSPENEFGTGGAQDYWAAIQGEWTEKEDGDPFATRCVISLDDNSCGSGGTSNEGATGQYRPAGYYYGVEIPIGSGITAFEVQIYDAGFYRRANSSTETGDIKCGSQQSGCNSSHDPFGSPGPDTTFTQRDTDATPFDHRDNPTASCSQTNPLTLAPEDTSPNTKNLWRTLCSFSVTGPTDFGVYPLQVQTNNGNGLNMYGLRACSPSCGAVSGTQPRVYGISDISIWANSNSSSPEFFLAEVEDVHAGKALVLELFDPGDAAPNVANSMSLIGPDDTVWPNCSYTVTSWKDGSTEESGTRSPPGGCTIDTTRTTNQCGQISSPAGCKYNGDWLTITLTLPNTYTCDPTALPSTPNDCWWKIRYSYGGAVYDRTTWAAKIIGNPVHLVFGG